MKCDRLRFCAATKNYSTAACQRELNSKLVEPSSKAKNIQKFLYMQKRRFVSHMFCYVTGLGILCCYPHLEGFPSPPVMKYNTRSRHTCCLYSYTLMVACAAQGKADGSPRLQPAGMHRIRKNTQKGASGCTIENKFKAKCPLLQRSFAWIATTFDS